MEHLTCIPEASYCIGVVPLDSLDTAIASLLATSENSICVELNVVVFTDLLRPISVFHMFKHMLDLMEEQLPNLEECYFLIIFGIVESVDLDIVVSKHNGCCVVPSVVSISVCVYVSDFLSLVTMIYLLLL